MRRFSLLVGTVGLLLCARFLGGCTNDTTETAAPPDDKDENIPGPPADTGGEGDPATPDDATDPPEPALDGQPTAPDMVDGGTADGGAPMAPSVACSKRLTVVFSVGTGRQGVAKRSNGCWTTVNASGSSNKQFRKCSTTTFVVGNPAAPNYAYDDTNPHHSLAQEKSFLAACSNGATGDGYEYLAYRGGWRILAAPHLKAKFAELYGTSPSDIDSLWYVSGVYRGGIGARADVFPMINYGPPLVAGIGKKVHDEALKICKSVQGGYFGTYYATFSTKPAEDDPRLVGLAQALNECTAK
jgi:hypothetical protein